MTGTIADYNEILAAISVGETVAAVLKAGIAKLQAERFDARSLERELVVKEIELELMKMRRDELAEDLFPDWQSEKRPAGRR